MERELLQEKIGHLETRRILWQTQTQLLSVLMEQSTAELKRLQAELEPAPEATLHAV